MLSGKYPAVYAWGKIWGIATTADSGSFVNIILFMLLCPGAMLYKGFHCVCNFLGSDC